ncbi:MAG: hypothetical protein OSB66_03265 [SAR202 cluster bacterium]|nr:hypothetical protein [SAR202 cluster bacterium]
MNEGFVALIAFWVFWRCFSRNPPPTETPQMEPIAFSWRDDDASDNDRLSDEQTNHKEFFVSVYIDGSLREFLSDSDTQYFQGASD